MNEERRILIELKQRMKRGSYALLDGKEATRVGKILGRDGLDHRDKVFIAIDRRHKKSILLGDIDEILKLI